MQTYNYGTASRHYGGHLDSAKLPLILRLLRLLYNRQLWIERCGGHYTSEEGSAASGVRNVVRTVDMRDVDARTLNTPPHPMDLVKALEITIPPIDAEPK